MLLPRDPVWRWFLGTLISVPACLAVWWFYLCDPLLSVLAWAVGAAAPLLWPVTVLDLKMQGGKACLISLVPTLTDPPRLFTLLPVSLNRAVAVFPLFWGFTLATPGRGLARRLLLGTVVLLPVAFIMALLYHLGQGVPRNSRKAAHWYAQAAQQGEVGGQYGLAVSYLRCSIGPPDPQRAFAEFLKLAERGYAPASYARASAMGPNAWRRPAPKNSTSA